MSKTLRTYQTEILSRIHKPMSQKRFSRCALREAHQTKQTDSSKNQNQQHSQQDAPSLALPIWWDEGCESSLKICREENVF